MAEAQKCPRCGDPLPPEIDRHRRGRRRIWCSDSCRSRASAERAAAAQAGLAVRVIEVPRSVAPWPKRPSLADPHSFEDAAVDVDACVALLEALTQRARHKRLHPRVRLAAYPFLRALLNTTPAEPPETTTERRLKPSSDAEKADDETFRRLLGPEKYRELFGDE